MSMRHRPLPTAPDHRGCNSHQSGGGQVLGALLLAAVLAGCAQDDTTDLREFMAQAGRDSQEKMEPLPQVQMVEAFSYDPAGLTDPFSSRNLQPARAGGGPAPDMSRPKEPLELFPLDGLRMVGTLSRQGKLYALVRTPENTLYRVKVGDHIGQNFGVVTAITDTAIEIKESIQDGAGDWTETSASLPLQE
ncbi:MAG: pilus assembly protein PilP [Thiobacillaceae bacterium]